MVVQSNAYTGRGVRTDAYVCIKSFNIFANLTTSLFYYIRHAPVLPSLSEFNDTMMSLLMMIIIIIIIIIKY